MAETQGRGDRLQELLDKQDIHEVLARYCRGLDRNDADIVLSVFHPDAVHNQIGRVDPASAFGEILRHPRRGVLRAVFHMISNLLVDLQGDTAFTECYFLACHRLDVEEAEWTWIVGGRYLDRLERRQHEWRIAERTAVYDWARLDKTAAILLDNPIVHSTDNAIMGRGDREDVSYAFAPGLG